MANPRSDLEQGFEFHKAGKLGEAAVCYKRVLQRDPRNIDALNLLGVACVATGQFERGVEFLRQCTRLHPKFADGYHNLGTALKELGKLEEAIAAYRRALELKPDYPEAYNGLGIALKAQGKPEEAREAYRQALRLRPRYAEAHNNLGAAFHAQNKLEEAIASYRQAIALKPDYAKAAMNEAMALLLSGQWSLGWPKYESRWESVQKAFKRNFPQPQWAGKESLQGKSILLHAEQGLGDTIQFLRYLPLVAAQAAVVYLEVQPSLKALIEASGLAANGVYAQGEPLPAFDLHCPLVSLPAAFLTQPDSIPSPTAYLTAPVEQVKHWAQSLAARELPRVGINWSGNPKNTNDRERSISLPRFKALLEGSDCQFFSVQKDRSEADARLLTTIPNVTDLSPRIGSFLDTAAIIMNLDLVITVDTSVAHLAGALGKRTWLLVPFSPDWRWLMERNDSPWYTSFRLFRQPEIGDWESVLGTVRTEMAREFSKRG